MDRARGAQACPCETSREATKREIKLPAWQFMRMAQACGGQRRRSVEFEICPRESGRAPTLRACADWRAPSHGVNLPLCGLRVRHRWCGCCTWNPRTRRRRACAPSSAEMHCTRKSTQGGRGVPGGLRKHGIYASKRTTRREGAGHREVVVMRRSLSRTSARASDQGPPAHLLSQSHSAARSEGWGGSHGIG